MKSYSLILHLLFFVGIVAVASSKKLRRVSRSLHNSTIDSINEKYYSRGSMTTSMSKFKSFYSQITNSTAEIKHIFKEYNGEPLLDIAVLKQVFEPGAFPHPSVLNLTWFLGRMLTVDHDSRLTCTAFCEFYEGSKWSLRPIIAKKTYNHLHDIIEGVREEWSVPVPPTSDDIELLYHPRVWDAMQKYFLKIASNHTLQDEIEEAIQPEALSFLGPTVDIVTFVTKEIQTYLKDKDLSRLSRAICEVDPITIIASYGTTPEATSPPFIEEPTTSGISKQFSVFLTSITAFLGIAYAMM